MTTALQSESTGAVIQGTDGALPSISKPPVEVTFATKKPSDGRPMDPDDGRSGRIAKGIERMQKAKAAAGKVPGREEPAPAKAKDPEAPPEKKPEPAKPAAKAPELKPAEAAEPEQADEPAEAAPEPKAEPEKPEAKPDAVELASVRADLEAARAELALERAKGKRGKADTADRDTYTAKPMDWLRGAVAKHFGLKPDAPEVNAELAYLQQELTIDALGADTLDDSRKQQRITDRIERDYRLNQLGRAASEATTRETQQRQRVVDHVSSVLDGVKDEFPDLAFAQHLFGASPAEVAVDIWVEAAREGRVQVTGDDAKDLREALRLTNATIQNRLALLQRNQPSNTAPAPAPAPAQPPTTGTAPGAAAAQPSTAPGPKKPASASPRTLPTKIAAAAPAVTADPAEKKKPEGPTVIDADDRGGFQRRLKIARDRLTK